MFTYILKFMKMFIVKLIPIDIICTTVLIHYNPLKEYTIYRKTHFQNMSDKFKAGKWSIFPPHQTPLKTWFMNAWYHYI